MQGNPNAPGERNADRSPGEQRPMSKPPLPTADVTASTLLFSLACSAATSSSLMNHFLSKRPDQQIGDEAGHQQPGEHVEDRVIDLVAGTPAALRVSCM